MSEAPTEASGSLSDHQFRQHVRNINTVYESTPPTIAKTAKDWYSRVHDMVGSEVRGTSLTHKQGSGIVAATSPNVDWNSANRHVLGDWNRLKSDDFNAISKGDRSPLNGMAISRSPTSGILKAKRIADGEDADDVLTGNKTNAFMHNIHDPSDPKPVTVDGRAYDIAKNSMTGWTQGRGISSSSKPGKARYEAIAEPYRAVARAQTEMTGKPVLPNQVQAVTWEHGKHIELNTPKKDGTKRVKGPTRSGQPYF